jgi:copper homeostasis protein (lipoprotein)
MFYLTMLINNCGGSTLKQNDYLLFSINLLEYFENFLMIRKTNKIFLAAVLFAIFLSGCRTGEDDGEQNFTYDKKVEQLEKFNEIEGIFTGELPCADCPGIIFKISLKNDSTFFMETTYLEAEKGQDKSFYDWGIWQIDSLNRISFTTTGGEKKLFKVVNWETIRMLDNNGDEIESALNYDLTKKEVSFNTEIPVKLTGYYSYMADSGLFMECLTGRTFFAAQKEANAIVEKEYLTIREEPNEKVFLTVEGYFTSQPKMDNGETEEVIVFTKFIEIKRSGECGNNN